MMGDPTDPKNPNIIKNKPKEADMKKV